ncbi:MAG: DUF2273 domain-containing protein [Clostridia bacterium]|nr:DUF2273 domain-containing protein [Clostridia bacterium]
MNHFKKGTPSFGLLLGGCFSLLGGLVMWVGFWRTLLLAALFALGYFIGAVSDKAGFVKGAVDRVVPDKNRKEETIDFRKEIEKAQDAQFTQETREDVTKEYSEDKE